MTESRPWPHEVRTHIDADGNFRRPNTIALIPRLGCGRSLLYAWVSLSHASLLVVGIRGCEVMGGTRFAGSVFTRQVLARQRAVKATSAGGLRRAASTSCRPRQLFLYLIARNVCQIGDEVRLTAGKNRTRSTPR